MIEQCQLYRGNGGNTGSGMGFLKVEYSNKREEISCRSKARRAWAAMKTLDLSITSIATSFHSLPIQLFHLARADDCFCSRLQAMPRQYRFEADTDSESAIPESSQKLNPGIDRHLRMERSAHWKD